MQKILTLIITCSLSIATLAQKAKLTLKFGTENKEVNQLLNFQKIFIETLTFKDPSLDGKSYQLFIKEFKKGKWVRTDTLFDGTESDYFKIKGDSLSFRFFAQTDNNELKLQVMSTKFGSKQSKYKTFPDNKEYVLKDFLGSEKELEVPVNKPFYILAVITPTIHKDGSGSYCEVAQSGLDPETFGTKFQIPHYFLIQMKFK